MIRPFEVRASSSSWRYTSPTKPSESLASSRLAWARRCGCCSSSQRPMRVQPGSTGDWGGARGRIAGSSVHSTVWRLLRRHGGTPCCRMMEPPARGGSTRYAGVRASVVDEESRSCAQARAGASRASVPWWWLFATERTVAAPSARRPLRGGPAVSPAQGRAVSALAHCGFVETNDVFTCSGGIRER